MAQPPAHERVRHRIREWVEREGHGSQRRLAQAVPSGKFNGRDPIMRSDQWVSDVLAGRQQLSLDDLDAVAAAMDVAPGWLVRGHDRNYEECTIAESKLLSFYRLLPELIQRQWLGWLSFVFDQISLASQRSRSVKLRARPQRDQEFTHGTHGPRGQALSVPDPAADRAQFRVDVERLKHLSASFDALVAEIEHSAASGSAPDAERVATTPAVRSPRPGDPHAKSPGGFPRFRKRYPR